jgi:hypothetical protein
MRPEMYAQERVAPRDLHDGDVVLWRRTATCVIEEPLARIAEGGMRVDYDVTLILDIVNHTVTVPGTFRFRRLRPRWEVE